jgi:hypothetical protein
MCGRDQQTSDEERDDLAEYASNVSGSDYSEDHTFNPGEDDDLPDRFFFGDMHHPSQLDLRVDQDRIHDRIQLDLQIEQNRSDARNEMDRLK